MFEPLAQRVVFGWGRAADVAAEVEKIGARRVMLVSTGATASVAGDAAARLGSLVAATIPRVRPHVPRDDVEKATDEARAAGVDLVVTIGGGSATGLGKAIVLGLGASLVAIPTTYAGSEATPIYGITEAGRKRTGRDARVLPRTVIYDPELTTSLPARTTASTGMNALAHCIEGLYARHLDPLTELAAVEGIRVLRRHLPACVADPADKTARSGALYGAFLAGTVIAHAGMAIHHRICHVLGGRFGVPHGDVNAAVLPHAVAFNQPAAADALARAADALDAKAAAPALFDLARALGAPTSLHELALTRDDLASAAAAIVEDLSYNPRPARVDDVVRILHAALEGRRPAAGSSGKETS